MSVLCPFCEGQGQIYHAVVKEDSETIYICGECDTVWLTDDISKDNCQAFDCYMLKKGLSPLWSELEDIDKL